jgi:hypothetical protein
VTYIYRTVAHIIAVTLPLLLSACGDSRAELCDKAYRHVTFLMVEAQSPLGRSREQIEYDAERLFRTAMQRPIKNCIENPNITEGEIRCILAAKTIADGEACDALHPR